MGVKVQPVPANRPTFLNAPRCEDLASLDADVAIIGIPYTVPYDMAASRAPSSPSPDALREQSLRFASRLRHYDFDFGGDLFAGRDVKIVDCGDVAMTPGQYEENYRAATAAVQAILDRGAVPIVLGGDHATTIPAVRAYLSYGSLCIVQIDAHMDWRDEINGVREGLSSPMRRSSELPWVRSMIQIGLRGNGSARQAEVDAARAFGSVLVGAEELHRVGVDEILRRVPSADSYYITIDADGLDPSIAPGVLAPAPGGLTYYQTASLLKGVARKGKIVGLDIVEIVPSLDVADLTTVHAVRLILDTIGALAHEGQIGKA